MELYVYSKESSNKLRNGLIKQSILIAIIISLIIICLLYFAIEDRRKREEKEWKQIGRPGGKY